MGMILFLFTSRVTHTAHTCDAEVLWPSLSYFGPHFWQNLFKMMAELVTPV